MRTLSAAPILALVGACASGPTLAPPPVSDSVLASYVDNGVQVAVGGTLSAIELAFEPCDGATVGQGPTVFEFEGNVGAVDVSLPPGSLCGVRLAVTELAIEADDAGVAKTVVGQDLDLWIPAEALPTQGGLELQLGGGTWLADFLPLAPAGTTLLNSESSPALREAFYDGLHQASVVEVQEALVD